MFVLLHEIYSIFCCIRLMLLDNTYHQWALWACRVDAFGDNAFFAHFKVVQGTNMFLLNQKRSMHRCKPLFYYSQVFCTYTQHIHNIIKSLSNQVLSCVLSVKFRHVTGTYHSCTAKSDASVFVPFLCFTPHIPEPFLKGTDKKQMC